MNHRPVNTNSNFFWGRLSNFIASLLCYVIMPLTPFLFEFIYSHPHKIPERFIIIAISTYSFSVAFGTKFRTISILLIVIGFISGGMYGAVGEDELATLRCFPAFVIYGLVAFSAFEWGWRHFKENEDCVFYTIFQK